MAYKKDQLTPYVPDSAKALKAINQSSDKDHCDGEGQGISKNTDDINKSWEEIKQKGREAIDRSFDEHLWLDSDGQDARDTVTSILADAQAYADEHRRKVDMPRCKDHIALIELYSSKMFAGNLKESMHSGHALHVTGCFGCIYSGKDNCGVDTRDPIVTGYLGDCGSRIMVIGEAPSLSGKAARRKTLQLPCPPEYEETLWCENSSFLFGARDNHPGLKIPHNSPLLLIDYLVKTIGNGAYPYFTDLIKCGVQKQNGTLGNLLDIREKTCAEHILWEEIQIIKPEYIICCHDRGYNRVVDLLKAKKWRGPTTVLRVYHYSQTNAISPKDKTESIWPIQTGFSSPKNPSIRVKGRYPVKVRRKVFS